MNGDGITDHSPCQPDAVAPIPGASNLILIDNYDSFTYNVFQYLVLEGAKATVYRNDEISLQELIALKPTQLVISPGPGNPNEDAGVSNEAISHFAGKIPVLGVCMGEQCIFTVFGGKVEVTGEILHGKTSPIRHDSQGLYAGLAQDLPVTRYHSLAATHFSLPECLEVTSWIEKGPDGGRGIIMGVRHKDLLVEGVQFHPESILTADGRLMLRNFLHMQGGTWAENQRLQKSTTDNIRTASMASSTQKSKPTVNGTSSHDQLTASQDKPTILEKIFKDRKAAVTKQKQTPSYRPADLEASYDLGLSPPQIDFAERLRQSPFSLSLMAEVKRASPSKGDIAPHICAPSQAKKYALAGASVISVLTEPKYFKGSIDDMRAVRQILSYMPGRPAVLRKEFIFDKYQILEARLAGADTVLLIVKMLERTSLEDLYHYSQSLGMEPLVEVNTVDEMKTALELGAKVIGVNNRDLTNFEVDLDTTSRLMEDVPGDTIVCALSGISGPEDVEAYRKNKVSAVLVGEALMKAADVNIFVDRLLAGSTYHSLSRQPSIPLVKICGTRTTAAAAVAINAGADLVGIILVEGRTRCVSTEVGLDISQVVRSTPKPHHQASTGLRNLGTTKAINYFDHSKTFLARDDRALLVGVFRNQSLTYILHMQKILNLDIVQLHGSEPVEWARLIPVPVIRRFSPPDLNLGIRGYHALPLLDSAVGGTGQQLDVDVLTKTLKEDDSLRVFLAGGLRPDNVRDVLNNLQHHAHQIVALDVSSGVETDGLQDDKKITDFISMAKMSYQ